MRIVTNGEIRWYLAHMYSGVTKPGDLTQEVAPYGTTDIPSSPSGWYTGFVVPRDEINIPDEPSWFCQGSAIYRNEKSVSHQKSTAYGYMSSSIVPVDGVDLVFPARTDSNQGAWVYYRTYVVRRLPLPSWIQLGPDEVGAVFLEAQWYRPCFHGVPSRPPSCTYRAEGMILSTTSNRCKIVTCTITGAKSGLKSPAEMIKSLDSIVVDAAKISTWRSTSKITIDHSDDTSKAIEKIRSKQRVVMAQLLNVTSITPWGDSTLLGETDCYKAQGHIVTSMASQVGRLCNNNAALLIELGQLVKDVVALCRGNPSGLKTLLREARTVRTKKQAAKLIAKCHLSVQYGYRLTAADVLEVANAIRRISTNEKIARSSCVYNAHIPQGMVVVSEHWKMFYEANPAKAPVMAQLFLMDLIGFQNVWDLIPYSFVVDWFTPAGDILQGWDDELMLSHLPINCIVLGKKSTFSATFVEDGMTYFLNASNYERKQVSSFPPFVTHTSHSLNVSTTLNGAALIVQRL